MTTHVFRAKKTPNKKRAIGRIILHHAAARVLESFLLSKKRCIGLSGVRRSYSVLCSDHLSQDCYPLSSRITNKLVNLNNKSNCLDTCMWWYLDAWPQHLYGNESLSKGTTHFKDLVIIPNPNTGIGFILFKTTWIYIS